MMMMLEPVTMAYKFDTDLKYHDDHHLDVFKILPGES